MTAEPALRTRLRRRFAALLVAAAVTAAGAACLTDSGPPTPSASLGPGNPEATMTAPRGPATPGSPAPSTTSGDGDSPAGGIRLTARAAPDGTFDVTEVVRLGDPISSFTLRPPDLAVLGGELGWATPVANDVQVTADKRDVKVPGSRISKVTSIALAAPARLITLRYRLTGVSKRSEPSTQGRALAGIAPLIAGVPDDLLVAVAVPGRTVRNLQCPTSVEQACAVGAPGKMRISQPLPWHSAIVIVQLDMT